MSEQGRTYLEDRLKFEVYKEHLQKPNYTVGQWRRDREHAARHPDETVLGAWLRGNRPLPVSVGVAVLTVWLLSQLIS